jgi:hypothetical protein
MKLVIKEDKAPHVPPVSFTIELPDELRERFDIDFLREHFWKHVLSAYVDLYVLESEEAITGINARVWERKYTLLDMFLEEDGVEDERKGGARCSLSQEKKAL